MKIRAIAKIDDRRIMCFGEIVIHSIKPPQAYVSWSLFDGETPIAGKSENFFFDKNSGTEASLINSIIRKIENYRIGRRKIFENVESID
jgi:hypothetical protein